MNINWNDWIIKWDEQQSLYLPLREERFNAMFDILEAVMPQDFIILDLTCGPGSISQRLLDRFSNARSIALDYNPVLLKLGQETCRHLSHRMSWIEGDLMKSEWVNQVKECLQDYGRDKFDAVLSTTGLHWLPGDHLFNVYQELGKIVRKDGLFFNGDNMAFPPHMKQYKSILKKINDQQQKQAREDEGAYKKWWNGIISDIQQTNNPELIGLTEKYFELESERPTFDKVIHAVHHASLYNAGFEEVGIIWQYFDNRIIMAVKGESSTE